MALKFNGIPVVWIRVTSSSNAEDQALRRDLKQFMWDHDIVPAVKVSDNGPHGESHGFAPADARKLIAWLKEHGGEVDPSVMVS